MKEYKQKYNNGIKEHRGGLGANIGGEEWEHKKEQNLKVKKYSEMIKNHNKDKENQIKNKGKIKNELNEQLYDSLSDEVLEDETKEKNKEKDKELNKDNVKDDKTKEENKDNKDKKRPESNKVKYLMQLKKEKEKENKVKDNKMKQGKYSKYKKIVIESIDKTPEPSEKKLGKIYTTYKPPMKRAPSSKGQKQTSKKNFNNNKQRSQSTGLKNHIYKNNNNNYDDDLTKKFMSPNPNNYNGYANNKDQNGNFMSPTFEIENLLHKKEQYDNKIKEIKNFLKI